MLNLKDRTTWIKSKVTLKEFFDSVGVRYQDVTIPHQIRCPFHGDDMHASARFFPMQNNGSGSFWCWACNDGGDLLWFAQAWHGLDNVVQACERLEEDFALERTQDDIVKDFFRLQHQFVEEKNHEKLVRGLLLYFETEATGRTHPRDPDVGRGWLHSLRDDVSPDFLDEFMHLETAMWVDFDRLSEELPKGFFSEALKSLSGWKSSYQERFQEVLHARSSWLGR